MKKEEKRDCQEHTNWMGELLADLMQATSLGWKVTLFSDNKEHCFTDQLLFYECKPFMIQLFFKNRKPVQFAVWEESVQKTGDWTFCLDCKFVSQKITVAFDREHHYEIEKNQK